MSKKRIKVPILLALVIVLIAASTFVIIGNIGEREQVPRVISEEELREAFTIQNRTFSSVVKATSRINGQWYEIDRYAPMRLWQSNIDGVAVRMYLNLALYRMETGTSTLLHLNVA